MNQVKWRKLAPVRLFLYSIFVLFLAVTSWSLTKSQQDEWIEKIGAKKISLVFASGYLSSAASSFGHTFLKLNNPKNQGGLELVDYGINYAARTGETDGALYALYGLLGYFRGAFGLLPYHQMIKEYTNLEGRDLWEYELDFTEDEVKVLLQILLNEEDKSYDYYFLTDNCSYRILWLLQRVRPQLNFFTDYKPYVIPLDTVKALLKQKGLVTRVSYRPSLKTKYEHQKKTMHRNVKKISINELSNEELEFALLAESLLDAKSKKVYELASVRASRAGLTKIIDLTSPQAPHLASEPRLLGFGNYSDGYELKLRTAFHDLLSNQIGAPRWSHLEVLSAKVRKDYTKYTYLRDLTFLELFSSSSIDEYFQPLSWGFKIAFQHDPLKRKFFEDIKLKSGFSWDFNANSDHRLFLGGIIDEGEKTNFGIQLMLLNEWTFNLRSQVVYTTFQKEALLNVRYNIDQNLEFYVETSEKALGVNWLF